MDTEELQSQLKTLLIRRAALQAQYDAILAQPASYSISGSVSATNRQLDELRAEMAQIGRKIARLLGAKSPGGMTITLPDYGRGGIANA